mmetsp:Transcript_71153/g.231103  ORF Transcript_71153/g.231103 Transcript_71153/m.231103 type:complete len:626 (-) Transcript_71153:56-1933(-)
MGVEAHGDFDDEEEDDGEDGLPTAAAAVKDPYGPPPLTASVVDVSAAEATPTPEPSAHAAGLPSEALPAPEAGGAPHRVRWEVFPSPHGPPYYYNPVTGESRWVLPTGPFDVIVPGKKNNDSGATASSNAGGRGSPPRRRASAEPGAAEGEGAGCGTGSSSSSSSSASSSGDEGAGERPAGAGAKRKPLSRLEAFREMLLERGVGCFDRYETWLPRLLGDARFTVVPLMERKKTFTEVARLLGKQQRQVDAGARLAACKGFAALVAAARERGLLSGARNAAEALSKMAKSDLGADKRWGAAAPKDRERMLAEVLKEEGKANQEEAITAVKAFRAMLQEAIIGPAESAGADPPPFGEARRLLRGDARWKAVVDIAERQRLYGDVASEAARRIHAKRKARAEDEDELTSKRFHSRRSEAEKRFREMLDEHLKAPLELTWPEARMLMREALKKSPPDLDEVSCEIIFGEVKSEDGERRLAAFADVLRRAPVEALGPELSFDQAKAVAVTKLPGGEARLQGLPPQDLRRCWEDWRRVRLAEASQAFEAWLQGCVFLEEAASDPDALQARGPAFEALCKRLSTDARYVRLSPVPRERIKLIVGRLEEAAEERAANRAACAAKAGGSDEEA